MNRAFQCTVAVALAAIIGGCSGGKQEVPLIVGQTYTLQSSGKVKVYPSAASEGAAGSLPLRRLRVKRKNEPASVAAPGCWSCTDCICNGDECGCTECSGC